MSEQTVNYLVGKGVLPEVAEKVAAIAEKDDANLPQLGRTDEEHQTFKECTKYLRSIGEK